MHSSVPLVFSDTDAKLKWQNLRSNYMREKRKVTHTTSGSGVESTKISWPYYSMMSFLDESLQLKKTVGNIPEMYTEESAIPSGPQDAGNEVHDTTNDDCNNEEHTSELQSRSNASNCGNVSRNASTYRKNANLDPQNTRKLKKK